MDEKAVTIDASMLSPDDWMEDAYVYALDSLTIGISPTFIEEWNRKTLMIWIVKVKRSGKSIEVPLPEGKLTSFYSHGEIGELTYLGNRVLVTMRIRTQES